MKSRAWHRAVAHVLLTTLFTGLVGCGDATRDAATSTTTNPEAVAQTTSTLPPPPTTVPPPTIPPPTPPSTLPEQPPEQLSKDELRDLVAPVALYPDVVLSSLLPATTYPEQVREAAEYVGQAETVDRIPDDRSWDGSIVGLLQFPDVVRWLDENPAWTDQMGQAVTYQQGDVLQAIQDYRKVVHAAGNLQSNQYQKVRSGGSNQDIYIEPAQPDVVYVPSYDPVVATQPQPAPAPGINPWIAFGGGAVVGALGAWALYSIFDDDDDDHHYYYGGRRGRYIRGYDNYYYHRGRRPRTVVWAPRNRPYRRVENWRRPRRLEYVAPRTRPAKRAALRPPTKRVGAPPPLSTEVKRDQRGGQGRRQGQMRAQDQRQQQKAPQQQRQDRQRQERQQRQQRQDRQQQKKQQQQQQRQQSQQRQQQQRQEKQQRQHEQRQEKQQRQQQQRERRQEQQPSMKQGGGNRGGGGGGGNRGGGGGGGGGKKNKKKKQGN